MSHLVIAGAGAAGLFAAATALSLGHRVTLVEHQPKPGQKLAITGKGRCNLTNDCDEAEFLKNIRRNPRFLYSAIYALPPAAVMDYFEHRLGIPLKVERGRRVFPQSDRAQDVVDALVAAAAGARRVRGKAEGLLIEGGRATGLKLRDSSLLPADAVLLATGGLSYPVTGSTGDGYRLAKQAGHAIVPPVPSLVAMVAQNPAECRAMAGLSLRNVKLSLLCGEKTVFAEQGELVFTHFGLSGPLVLSASAYLADMEKHQYTVSLDLKPALDADKLDARLQRDFAEASGRDTAHALDKLAPVSLRPVLLARWGADPSQKIAHITREERRALCALLKDFRIPIKGRGDLEHAVITSGGVDTKQVDPKTMESKLVPGLYFAGEILDVDGYTGGYNLQIAWCTAYAAVHGV